MSAMGWADVATKSDLDKLRSDISSGLHKMETKLTRLVAFTNLGAILTVAVVAFGAARLA